MKKVSILPPTYLFIFLILSIFFHFLFPILIISDVYRFFGVIFVVMGILLNIWADNIFKKEGTTVKPNKIPSRLVTKGPFQFSRHPMYLGSVLILLGVSITLGSVSSFFSPLMMFLVLEKKFIPLEEHQMKKQFGEKYLIYKKNVRRWL